MRGAVIGRQQCGWRRARLATVIAMLVASLATGAAGAFGGADPAHAAMTQSCRITPAPEHVHGWRSADLGCPTEVASPIEAVEQFFELGMMFWRADTRTIYVLASRSVGFYSHGQHGSGEAARGASGEQRDQGSGERSGPTGDGATWRSFADHFYDGQPESAGYWPPDERLQEPVRGFGKVWREQLGGPSAPVGWATTYERGVRAAVQAFERGLVIRSDTGRVYVLRNNGTWASYRV